MPAGTSSSRSWSRCVAALRTRTPGPGEAHADEGSRNHVRCRQALERFRRPPDDVCVIRRDLRRRPGAGERPMNFLATASTSPCGRSSPAPSARAGRAACGRPAPPGDPTRVQGALRGALFDGEALSAAVEYTIGDSHPADQRLSLHTEQAQAVRRLHPAATECPPFLYMRPGSHLPLPCSSSSRALHEGKSRRPRGCLEHLSGVSRWILRANWGKGRYGSDHLH